MSEPFVYHRGFLAADRADALLATLQERPWQSEHLTLFGRARAVPRLLAWCGDRGLNYRYTGTDHVCGGWWPELGALRRCIAARTGVESNFVLLNRYRAGDDYMGWHRDDERGLACRVASISLGASRRFLIRPSDGERATALDLEHGSLLILDGAVPHSLPRTRRPVGERINLTFRRLGEGT